MALVLSVTMLVPAQAAYAAEEQAEESGLDAHAEGRAADADGFVIEHGVLKSYTGTATEVVVPEEVTSIGMGAFSNRSDLISITIPEGVTNIENYAFSSCSSLMAIKVEEGNKVFDSRENCNAVIRTESNALIVGCGSTIIPEGVTSIGYGAFLGCSSLTSVIIPESVASIQGNAFWSCSGLESIKVEEGNGVYDSRKECNAIIETASNTLLEGCKNTVIPEGVMIIGRGAFLDCIGLKDVTIPKGVASIEAGAFNGCSNLVSVTMSEGLTSIYESAFINCSSLESVAIPEGVTFMGSAVFYGCSSLASVTIPKGLTDIGSVAFYGCSNLESVEISEGITYISPEMFSGCRRLAEITLPKSVEEIASWAFSDCSRLKKIIIPEEVLEIGDYAFSGCSGYLTIYGKTGSCAETYAKENDILFSSTGELSHPIEKKIISSDDVALSQTSYVYDGIFKKPTVTVKDGATVLKEGIDYTVTYSNNVSVGTATVTVTGRRRYTGTVTKKFTITNAVPPEQEVKGISECTVTLGQNSYVYDGTAKTPTVTVKDGTTALKEGTDYTVTYSNNINVGIAKATVIGKGNYTGTVTKEFTITKAAQGQRIKEISQCKVTLSKSSYAYDGKAKKPTATVKDGAVTLKEGTDYTVAYTNNINAGTAKVTVTGKGNYKGAVAKNFTITVKKGTSHKVGSCQYKVTGTSTVSAAGAKNNKVTKIKIPKTVKIGGKAFKVTAIASRAFKGNKKITSIEIGDNVKMIGTSAFEGCTKLGKATLGKGIIEISGNAFTNCKKLGTVTIKSTKLKKVGRNALKGIKPTAKIKVPAKKLPAYKKLFKNKGQGRKVKILK